MIDSRDARIQELETALKLAKDACRLMIEGKPVPVKFLRKIINDALGLSCGECNGEGRRQFRYSLDGSNDSFGECEFCKGTGEIQEKAR